MLSKKISLLLFFLSFLALIAVACKQPEQTSIEELGSITVTEPPRVETSPIPGRDEPIPGEISQIPGTQTPTDSAHSGTPVHSNSGTDGEDKENSEAGEQDFLSPYENALNPAIRGDGVPHTSRTLATRSFSSDRSGSVYGVITAIDSNNDGCYVSLAEYTREEGTPIVDGQGKEHRIIDAVPTGEELILCIGKSCSISLWEPYSDYSYDTAATTIEDVRAVMSNRTTYGEPYFFKLTLRSGVAYDLSLWRTFYDYQTYKHGLSGVIYSDGSAVGSIGGLVPEVAEQYKDRETNGVVVEPRPTPTPKPTILVPLQP